MPHPKPTVNMHMHPLRVPTDARREAPSKFYVSCPVPTSGLHRPRVPRRASDNLARCRPTAKIPTRSSCPAFPTTEISPDVFESNPSPFRMTLVGSILALTSPGIEVRSTPGGGGSADISEADACKRRQNFEIFNLFFPPQSGEASRSGVFS
ncbi:hypothetical protein VUR80DRAFT_3640 [Thermomyces stellatus]